MSATSDVTKLLRAALLDGVRVLVASPAVAAGATHERGEFAAAVTTTCAALGARVSAWRPGDDVAGDVDQLVVDAAGMFAAGGAIADAGNGAIAGAAGATAGATANAGVGVGVGGGDDDGADARAALSACLDGAWEATRAVANVAFIESGRAGRVVYLAPASAVDLTTGQRYADAARAGLENLARTLSIEWARYGVTPVTIAPGAGTSAEEVATATAFLASPAGSYYSGCLLDMRGLAGVARRRPG